MVSGGSAAAPCALAVLHGLVGLEQRRAQGLGPGLLVEFADRLKLAQEMGVAEGVIDVFEAVVGAPVVVDHDAALERGHGRAGLAGAIEGVGQGRGGVQPAGRAGDAQARFVEAAHRRRRDAGADAAIDRLQRLGLTANPARHARPAGRRRPEQVPEDLRGPLLGHELLGVEIDRRRLEALAILGRRNDARGKSGAGAPPAGRAVVDRRAVLGHDQRLLRKIEDLTPLLADLGIRRKSRPAMRAYLGRVLDDRVGLGDLAQRVAVVAFLASARLARARAQALQDPRLLLQPVARRRLRAVGAVQAQPSPKLRHLSAKRSISRAWAAISSSTSGGRFIPPLSQKSRPCRPKSQPASQSRAECDISNSPRLGSYSRASEGQQPHE